MTIFRPLKGDTLVEVMFAVGIFGLVAIGAIGIMNKGLYDSQRALEIAMARNEIDAQAEALRFIHESYITEKKIDSTKVYTPLWEKLKSIAVSPDRLTSDFFSGYPSAPCDQLYNSTAIIHEKSFIVNTRRLDPTAVTTAITNNQLLFANGEGILIQRVNIGEAFNASNPLSPSPTHPRLLFSSQASSSNDDIADNLSDRDIDETTSTDVAPHYTLLTKAQGIWITNVASDTSAQPEYYDFYIRTCWYAPGSTDAVTVSTTVRLFNPEH